MPSTCWSEEDFMIPNQDAAGKSCRIQLAVHPGQYRMLEHAAEIERYGLSDKRDVARWCICWGLHSLFGPSLSSFQLREAKLFLLLGRSF